MNTDVMLANQDTDFGLVPAKKAKARALALANEEGIAITLRDPISDKVIATVKPKAAKAKAAAKPAAKPAAKHADKRAKPAKAKQPAAKAKRAADAAKQPRGMVVEILKLASRTKGVSPAELNELTTWKGAPWKWLFSNPKKNGYCDRWGYKFEAVNGDEGVRYFVIKR
jgi:hypothetical protein